MENMNDENEWTNNSFKFVNLSNEEGISPESLLLPRNLF